MVKTFIIVVLRIVFVANISVYFHLAKLLVIVILHHTEFPRSFRVLEIRVLFPVDLEVFLLRPR